MRRVGVVLVLVVVGLFGAAPAYAASTPTPAAPLAVTDTPTPAPSDTPAACATEVPGMPAGVTCVWVLNPASAAPVDTSSATEVGYLRSTVTAGFGLVLFVGMAYLIGRWRR